MPHSAPATIPPTDQDFAELQDRVAKLEREIAELKCRLARASDVDPTAGKDPNFKWDGDG